MARSVADATRFTATVPVAHSKTQLRGSTIDFARSIPPAGETPQQKVARLRALAQKAKLDNISTVDRVVLKGRTWADRAHRFTTFSLIGFTGFAFLLTIVGAGQLVFHSRQRKAEWLLQQKLREVKELALAQEAQAAGTATEDQILRINQDRARKTAEAERASQKSIFGKVREALSTQPTPAETAVTIQEVVTPVLAAASPPTPPVAAEPTPVTATKKGWYDWIMRK